MFALLILTVLLTGCTSEPVECPENELITVYRDEDRDGFGVESESQQVCMARLPLEKWAPVFGDCDDLRSDVYPGAPELCDGIDNSCDGTIDVGLRSITFWVDADEDGFGDPSQSTEACQAPPGYVQNNLDCDDSDPETYPGANEVCDGKDNSCNGEIDDDDPYVDPDTYLTWYADEDLDGYGDPYNIALACAAPPGFVDNADDCDDADPEINPDAVEVCDGIDNNCNGLIDDSDPTLDPADLVEFCRDNDGDGYGDPSLTALACNAPWFYVPDCSDCDDSDPTVHSDGDTFWALDADGDGFAALDAELTGPSCDPPDAQHVPSGLALDCDDNDPLIHPAALEICDEIDNNCSGLVDDEDPALHLPSAPVWFADLDGDTFGDPDNILHACVMPEGYVENDEDCDDTRDDVHPDAVEVCDGVDNTCNELVDADDPDLDLDSLFDWYLDFDQDGWGDPAVHIESCDQPLGYVGNDLDCDDDDPDSGAWRMWVQDLDGDGFGAGDPVGPFCHPPDPTGWVVAGGPEDCDDTDPGTHPGAIDICNDGIDQDCDGEDLICIQLMADTCDEVADEDFLTTGSHSFQSTFEVHTNAIQLSGSNTCTGSATPGADGLLPVRLEPGEAIWATYTSAGDASIYLINSCSASPSNASCILGTDLLGPGGTENLWAHNTGVAAQEVFLVLDCASPDCGDYDVELEIGTPDPFFLPDTCSQAQSTPALVTGGYGIRSSNASQTNTVSDPNTCTNFSAAGRESIVPVTLQPGETMYAEYSNANDGSLYLVTDCTSGATCLDGSDNFGNGTWEYITYTHLGAGPTTYYLVLDCWTTSDTCGVFQLQLLIE